MCDSTERLNTYFVMSSISRAGIFIDIKALLEYTDRMVGEMTIADRRRYGDDLVRLNLAMIGDFTIAFHRKEDKHQYIDQLEADFESFKALMEFCWAKNKFSRIQKRKRRRKHKHFMELMAKLQVGIVKWSASVPKQVAA